MKHLEALTRIEAELNTCLPSVLELLKTYSTNKKVKSFEYMMRQINYTLEHLEEQITHEQ